jgi:DNA modification methylase
VTPTWATSDGSIKLYLGDARDILPTLAPVDAVIVDPPYGIAHETNHGASWQGKQISGDTDTAVRDFILAWSAGVPWACFGTWKVPTPADARGVLVWDKGPAFGMGDLSFPWKASWEEIAIGGDGWAGYRDEGVLRGHIIVSWESKGRKHPHQKPVSLVCHLLKKLPHASLICDPCMGSGTTIEACVRLGRQAIGIELDPEHYATAEHRAIEAVKATALFEPPPAIVQRSLLESE